MVESEVVRRWAVGHDTGISSLTLAAALYPELGDLMLGGTRGRWDAPYDPADLGRCVRLLELCGGESEVKRPEVVQRLGAMHRNWLMLMPRWDDLVIAYHQDRIAQEEVDRLGLAPDVRTETALKRARAPRGKPSRYPPARSYWLLCKLQGRHDPYEMHRPHPFEAAAGG